MKQETRIAPAHEGPTLAQLAVAGSLVLFPVYTTVFLIARELPIRDAASGSVANVISIVGFGLIAYRIVQTRIVGRGMVAQILGHLIVGMAYSALVYWLIVVLIGALFGASLVQFQVTPFPVRASAWQFLENLTTYGIIAAIAYRGHAEEVTLVLSEDGDPAGVGLSRYFIRSGDSIKPVDVGAIISITGADDYAEVRTMDDTHLVRLTLAEFEKSLDPGRFIRVHRSRIVNVERIDRAEPAGGGRLLLYMEDGEAIAASRSGSRLLKDRVI